MANEILADIERNKTRAEFDITYDVEVLRLIDNLQNLGISINSVVITLYKGQARAENLKKLLKTFIKIY